MSHHNGITSHKHHFSIEFGQGGGAPELATETENTLSLKKLRNDCNAGITELFDPQLNPLTEASN